MREIKEIPIEAIKGNKMNPNKMNKKKFSFLKKNLEENGFLENLVAVDEENGTFELVGGHHRLKAARELGFETVPCVILDKEVWTREKRNAQLVKLNAISGELSPKKFVKLYNQVSEDLGGEVAAEYFALEEDELKGLLKKTRKSLPKELRPKFDEVKKDIKNIDELSSVVNRLFSKYGKTLDLSFIHFMYGGKMQLMVQMSSFLHKKIKEIKRLCEEQDLDINVVLEKIFLDSTDKVLGLFLQEKNDK